MSVGSDRLPVVDAFHGSQVNQHLALFLGAEVVADVSVEDAGNRFGFCPCVWVDCMTVMATPTGVLASNTFCPLLASAGFSGDVGPPSEVEYVDGGEFVG